MKRILAATAALLALSACGSQDPPTAADPTTSSPPPATSSKPAPTGPAVPTMPAAARQRTRAGAIAFAKYYWRVVDYAQATGDTAELRRLGTPTCHACDAGADWVDKVAARGGSIRGGANEIKRSWVPVPPSPKHPSAAIILRIYVTKQIVTGAGRLDVTYQPGTDMVDMEIAPMHGHWLVSSWDIEDHR